MKPNARYQQRHQRLPRHARRRGVVLVCVLVCLSVASTLAMTATHAVLKQRQHLRTERQLRQVELLIDAGRRRAITKLEISPAYLGETWRLETGSVPGFSAATVRIDVADAQERVVTVVATLPADSATPVKRSHQFLYPPPGASLSPGSQPEPATRGESPKTTTL